MCCGKGMCTQCVCPHILRHKLQCHTVTIQIFRSLSFFFHQFSHLFMLEVDKLLMVADDHYLTTKYEVKVVSVLNLNIPQT